MPAANKPSPPSFTLDDALAWLASDPSEDPLADLVPIRRSLRALTDADIPPAHKFRILRIFEPRLSAVHRDVMGLLLDSALPLSRALSDVTRATNENQCLCADILFGMAVSESGNVPPKSALPTEDAVQQCLVQLDRQLVLALLAFGQPPHGLWTRIGDAFRFLAGSELPACDRNLGKILALSAAQPESLTPRELAFLHTVVNQLSGTARMSSTAPDGFDAYFWVDIEQNLSPVASSRQLPPADGDLLYLNFTPLMEELDGFIRQLESGTPAVNLGLPREANAADYLNVLRRTSTLLSNPPKRQFPRRRYNHEVRMCVRLGELWRLLHEERESEREVSEWMVINKSPDGCAVEHISGNISGLIAGGALGIRETADAPWSVCLVRRVRSTTAEHLELGLELVAPHAQAIRIVPNVQGEESIPGLLLPALPQISRRETLMIARGRYQGSDFNLLAEKTGKIMLTECKPGALIHQTSSVEVFEFDRLRVPV